MRIPIKLNPQDFIDEYKLQNKIHNGHIYCEICKGIYGLPQAGKLANDLLRKRLRRADISNANIHQDYGNTYGAQ